MENESYGLKGTCRYCGRAVMSSAGNFVHVTLATDCKYQTMANEYCGVVRADGVRCVRPIPPDNLADDVYGCAYHVKQANQERERSMRSAMQEDNRRNLAELEAYEMSVYQQAEYELRSKLGSDVFGDNHSVRQLRGSSFLCRTVAVDWVELNNLIPDKP